MIQIELRPEIEARLAAQAQARGVDIEAYVETLLEQAVSTGFPQPRRRTAEATAPAGRNELAQGRKPWDSSATKIRSPVGRDTGLFGLRSEPQAERASVACRWDRILHPQGIEDKCAAPLGLGLFVLSYSQGFRPGLTHAAPPALAPKRSAAFLPTLPSKLTSTQIINVYPNH